MIAVHRKVEQNSAYRLTAALSIADRVDGGLIADLGLLIG
jgi:hypothetical protein